MAVAGILVIGVLIGSMAYTQNVKDEASRVAAEQAAAASQEAAAKEEEETKKSLERERRLKADAARAAKASASAKVIEEAMDKGWTHFENHVFYGENNTDCNQFLSCVSLMFMSTNECPRGIRATLEFTNQSGNIVLDTVYRSTGPLTPDKQAVLEFVTSSEPASYQLIEASCR